MMRTLIYSFCCVIGLVGASVAATEIEEVISPGGIKAWLVQEPSIPMVAIEIGFQGGTLLDPADRQGVTNLMTGLLEEGTGDLDSADFAREREALAARFGFDAGPSEVTISAQVLVENLEPSLDLLRRAIVAPRFDQTSIDRVRGQVLSMLAGQETDGQDIASATISKLTFGDHPYSYRPDGIKEHVEAVTQEDIFAAHRAVMTRDRVLVGVVGAITPEELGPLLDQLLGDLPETGAPMPTDAEYLATGGITIVDLDQPQSTALWYQPGMKQDDPDYFAAVLLNYVLGGGGFESRLTDEVREKRGLTYGVGSFLSPRRYAAVWGGYVASANDTVAEAIDVIKAEWTRMAAEGPTAEELEAAKKFVTGSYALRFDGNATIAGILVGMQSIDLPIDYIPTRNDRVNAVTLDDVQRVARDMLQPDALRFVVVGRPEGLEATE